MDGFFQRLDFFLIVSPYNLLDDSRECFFGAPFSQLCDTIFQTFLDVWDVRWVTHGFLKSFEIFDTWNRAIY